MKEAGQRFIADMERLYQAEWLGRLALAGGPYPVTPIATSVPKAPTRAKRRAGPRDTRPDGYRLQGVVFDLPTVATTDAWEYELAAAFVRPLPKSEVLTTDLPALLARAKNRR